MENKMGYGRRDISDNILNILKKKNISIDEFSRLMKISLKDAGRVLDGRVILSDDSINKVIHVLNISEDDLYSECNRAHYRHEFEDDKNRNLIMNIIDMYINLKEKEAI